MRQYYRNKFGSVFSSSNPVLILDQTVVTLEPLDNVRNVIINDISEIYGDNLCCIVDHNNILHISFGVNDDVEVHIAAYSDRVTVGYVSTNGGMVNDTINISYLGYNINKIVEAVTSFTALSENP